jgi:hypothetical protein
MRAPRDNLTYEYIALTNTGGQAINMGGWTVSDAASRNYTIPMSSRSVRVPP